ncbi:hypothetical protein EJ08DRAFT_553285, partial [Tothia fuscella]
FDNFLFFCFVISPPRRSIYGFKSTKELREAFRDFIRADGVSWPTVHLDGQKLHRDMLDNNIIITKQKKDGDSRGRLNDRISEKSSTLAQVVGTMEFMAIEVLEGKSHTYRHDLESFFYVFLF